jgi:hypothetical protein
MRFQPDVSAAVARPRPRLRLVDPIAAPLAQIHSPGFEDLLASIARGVDEAFASFAREFRC